MCNFCIGIARSDTHARAVAKRHTYTILCQQHLCMAVLSLEQPVMCFGNIVSRGGATRISDTFAVALTYYSSSSRCRHISHSILVPSVGRTAKKDGEFCLMYTHLSARSMVKQLCPLLSVMGSCRLARRHKDRMQKKHLTFRPWRPTT
jgi:hypothetical protein